MKIRLLSTVALLLCAACTQVPTAADPSADRQAPTAAVATDRDTYRKGPPQSFEDGKRKVLFFHAGWCPYCKAHDVALRAWDLEAPLPLDVYNIDFDASLDLRSRFGVLSQDTFILVDGNGNKLAELSGYPSAEAVLNFIRTP